MGLARLQQTGIGLREFLVRAPRLWACGFLGGCAFGTLARSVIVG